MVKRKKIFTKKKVTGVAALLVAIAIVITGTFAWIDITGTIGVRTWWLRSPGNLSAIPASIVSTDGLVTFVTATNTCNGFRAALWLHQ